MMLQDSKILSPFIALFTFLFELISDAFKLLIVLGVLIVENFWDILEFTLKLFALLLLAYNPVWGLMLLMLVFGAF